MSDHGGDADATGSEPASTDPDATTASGEEEAAAGTADTDGDTFGVGIHVTSDEFRFVVHVPSDIDAGWRDPDEFQRLIEEATWERLDQRETLQAVARTTAEGTTATLGTVTMRPGGDVVEHSLTPPAE